MSRTYHLAEGATGPFYSTDLILANPNNVQVRASIAFFKDDGTTVALNPFLPATQVNTDISILVERSQ